MSKVVSIAILGAGARGRGYAAFAKSFPDRLKIAAVAEPNDYYRNLMAEKYNIPADKCFKSWDEFTAQAKMCDAVAICTQDCMHEAPAIACAKLGYHILLEKPMAPTAEACKRIVAAVKEAGVMLAVCHVLRYTEYTAALRKIIESGEIGEIVSIQHLEPVGYWHQAHSFVRGLWRNEAESSFMLLAKSCHDVDWLRGIMNKRCVAIHSFGSLRHFKASEKPAGAADRCLDCPADVESFCPYSAVKIYFRDRFCKGAKNWPVNVLTPQPTAESLKNALQNGDYGRCVYACDNDVVDNQVVNISFEDGSTASMTMTAFNFNSGRKTRIFGTRGEIDTDSQIITIRNFLDDTTRTVDTQALNDGGILSGHGGGDMGLMHNFVQAVAENDPSLILTGVDETLESHLMVFAAEKSRREGIVCTMDDKF
ncbi:MAG: Gfo/Idh/MocA family oxidoreductase [Lentisphaeria bacterium]|nr:Gfo/Idh/MocA family oxidoreductase [Lentisphaeria bacterium]